MSALESPTVSMASAGRLAAAGLLTCLLVATHWPGLDVNALHAAASADVVYHIAAYAICTFVMILLLSAGRVSLSAGHPIVAVCLVMAGVAVLDELTQPLMGRNLQFRDVLCDWSGIAAAAGTAAWIMPRRCVRPASECA